MNIRRPTDLRKKSNTRDAKKHIIIAGVGIACLLTFIGVVIAVKQSNAFVIRTIEVLGVPTAYGEQIQRDLEAFSQGHSLLFRFLGANNVLAWDGSPKEFLAENPQFKTLHIQKDYARRTVTITVDGREKFGVWCSIEDATSDVVLVEEEGVTTTTEQQGIANKPDNACYWFDADGILFAKAPQVQSELFNRVYDSTGQSLGLRDKILPERLFVNVKKIFTLLEIAGINTKTVFISDIALEEVYTESVTDPRIMFSLRFDPFFSLSAINALKRSGEWSKLEYANFTVENRVAYR